MKNMIFVIGMALILSCCQKDNKEILVSKNENKTEIIAEQTPRIEIDYGKYYAEAKGYALQNNLNTDKFILIDLGLHSGYKRFFVYDFKDNTISKSYMVSHGCGDNPWEEPILKTSRK
ncbi:murein L,D-transpeptidase catalytic domain-containing protein [Flavobacterium johnsoniae]|uniref:murein L,D-transpeptidase catalytic domain-containing protein n=1 Tax=Flavobacterium johnsoniae TaxID=986 RepID=UPI0011EF269E|nr:murein L,D-transpeptidase catalytic domain family protein [Flavobacterium johnsoniae]